MKEEIKNNTNKIKNKSKRRMISNLIFLALSTIFVIIMFSSIGDFKEIGNSLSTIKDDNNWLYLLIALFLTLAYMALYPISLGIFAKACHSEAKFVDVYLTGCSEHFYNGITPFAAGGQPFQVYSLTKCGVSTSKATGIVLGNFVTFMLVTNTFAFISLFFFDHYLVALETINMEWLKGIAIAGFAINFLILLFMIALGTSKKLKHGIEKIIILLCKIKFIKKHLEKSIPLFEEYCDNSQIAFKEVWKHKIAFLLSFLVKSVTMACYYAIPFFLLKAIGITLSYDMFILVLFATSFAITTVVWMPTPGDTGAIEFAFYLVIASVATGVSKEQATTTSLLWRMLTYYFVIIVSFIISIFFELKVSKYLKEKDEKDEEPV